MLPQLVVAMVEPPTMPMVGLAVVEAVELQTFQVHQGPPDKVTQVEPAQ